MKITLKEFQVEAIEEMLRNFRAAQKVSASKPQAVVLSAPTGSGKTVIATAFIEALLTGDDDEAGNSNYTFLWLTDQPELNLQTEEKMLGTSSVLTSAHLVVLDAGVDAETLQPGRVYFLNTQKLAISSTLTKKGDDRTWSLWDTLTNSIDADPSHFIVIIDEAHRGMRGRDALEADSIVQKFLKGSSGEVSVAPLVVGISATPDRFRQMLEDTKRVAWSVDVDPQAVRDSGLIKEVVDLYHPDEGQASHVTMLEEAVRAWKEYTRAWREYAAKQGEGLVRPILLVQVEDGVRGKAKGEETVSKTDLALVVSTLFKEIGPAPDSGWIAHAFQEGTDLNVGAHAVRHIAPSKIDGDPDVLAVLFKTSLNTGWDCPRAETMVSFRTAKDETNIAQLVGRMVRAPLARRIDGDESLNSVALYLPYYDHKTVKKIVDRLTSDPSVMPPTEVREGTERARLGRRKGAEDIFALLAALPTYTVPRRKKYKPVVRLGKLAGLLAETSLLSDPVKTYRAALVKVLTSEYGQLKDDETFKARVVEAGVLGIARVRVKYGVKDGGGSGVSDEPYTGHARIADTDVDGIFADAGRLLGEGLHKEYARERKGEWDAAATGATFPMRTVKLEAWALASNASVLTKLNERASNLANDWVRSYKAAFANFDEKYRQQLREIEGATDEPVETTLEIPDVVEWSKAKKAWDRHIFVEEDGTFHDDFATSSWESAVMTEELKNKAVVGWLRSVDRKPWAVCTPYKRGGDWVGTYPDFLLFRKTEGGIIADIVDPHLLSDENAPARAGGLARYAEKHLDQYGRIDLVIVDGSAIRRLDLTDATTRGKVLGVTTHSHLKQLFDAAPGM